MKNKIITTEIKKENIDENCFLTTFTYQDNFIILNSEGAVLSIINGKLKYDNFFKEFQKTSLIRPKHSNLLYGFINLEFNFIDVMLEFDKPYFLLIKDNKKIKSYLMYARKGKNDGILCFEDIKNFDFDIMKYQLSKDELYKYLENKKIYFDDYEKIKDILESTCPSFYEYDLYTELDRILMVLSNLLFESQSKKNIVDNLIVFDQENNLSKITVNKMGNEYTLIEKNLKFSIPVIEGIDSLPERSKILFDNISTYGFCEYAYVNRTKVKRYK